MPIMTGRESLAANANSQNVLAQLPFEFVSGAPSVIKVSAVVDVDGTNITFQSGGETLAQDTLIFPQPGENPLDIFHQYLKFLAAPGERLFMTFQNGANAAVIFWAVDVIPVG